MNFDIVELKETVATELATRMTTSKAGTDKLDPQGAREWKEANVAGLPSRKKKAAYDAYVAEWGRQVACHVQNQVNALGLNVKYVSKRRNGDVTVVYKGQEKPKLQRQAEAIAMLTGQDPVDIMEALAAA